MPIERDQAACLLENLVSLLRTAKTVAHRDAGRSLSGTPGALLHTIQTTDVRPGDLAERLRIDPSVVSRVVAALERDGYVERVPDPEDARAYRVHITDVGREHLRQREERVLGMLVRTFDNWTTEDVDQLLRGLSRLVASAGEWVAESEHEPSEAVEGAPPSTNSRTTPAPSHPAEEKTAV